MNETAIDIFINRDSESDADSDNFSSGNIFYNPDMPKASRHCNQAQAFYK